MAGFKILSLQIQLLKTYSVWLNEINCNCKMNYSEILIKSLVLALKESVTGALK